jgi:hypothetical protein
MSNNVITASAADAIQTIRSGFLTPGYVMLLFILYGCALESSTPDFSAKVMRQTK